MGLTIDSIVAVPIRAPRTKPMISAGGFAPLRVSDFGIVRIRTSDGIEGVGEISMNNGRDGAIQCDDVNRLLGPALVGQSPLDVRRHIVAMDRVMDGSEPAKAAVEMALWDIVGKDSRPARVRAVRRKGPRSRVSSDGAWRSAIQPPASMRSRRWIAQGRPHDQGEDRAARARVSTSRWSRAVRDAVGDSVNVMVDANSGYRTSLIAVQELERLESYRLQLIEQPVHRKRLAELAFIRGHISTPILADESMRHWSDAYDVARAGAADALGIYVCEAGGMLAALNAARDRRGRRPGGDDRQPVRARDRDRGDGARSRSACRTWRSNRTSPGTCGTRSTSSTSSSTIAMERFTRREIPGLGVTLNEEVLERWRLDR